MYASNIVQTQNEFIQCNVDLKYVICIEQKKNYNILACRIYFL